MIKKSFWKQSLTSQFLVCPVPFHLDTYRGCHNNCVYCFARDLISFNRRNSGMTFDNVVSNDAEKFDNYLSKIFSSSNLNFKKGEEIALRERIPLKIGANSDPLPHEEASEHTTIDFLRVLNKYDYPVQIQTKNPHRLIPYAEEISKFNLVVSVSLTSTDESFVRIIEPNSPTAQERLKAIKTLTDNNIPVMIKIQPVIYPKILDDADALVHAAKDAGCWSINTEGLKLRLTMPLKERELFNSLSEYLGFNIFEFYRNQIREYSDLVLRKEVIEEYSKKVREIAHSLDLKYFSADNCKTKLSDGNECCGTELLTNYKLWEKNIRTDSLTEKHSYNLGRSVINFTRGKSYKNKTLDAVYQEKIASKIRTKGFFLED